MVKGRALGRTEGTIRRTGSGRTENARARSERSGCTKKRRRGLCAEGKPKTRGCGTGVGIYEQAGTREQTKERAEGVGGKLVWGCFAFLMGLKHVNATPSSRKIPFVDINRRYVRSVGRLTSFWKIWPGKMLAEARANGFLRTRGLTYRRLLSTALCFSRRSVVESQWEKGGSGGDASSTRGIAPGSRLDSPQDTD